LLQGFFSDPENRTTNSDTRFFACFLSYTYRLLSFSFLTSYCEMDVLCFYLITYVI